MVAEHTDAKDVISGEGVVLASYGRGVLVQAQGRTLTAASDVYSLAVILYEVLTGKLPFDARNAMEYIQHHVTGKPIPINQRTPGRTFPPLLEQIVHRALAKRPEDRFATAADFGTALQWVLNGAAQLPPHLAPPSARTAGPIEVRSMPSPPVARLAIGSPHGASKPTLPDLAVARRGMSVQLLVAVAVAFTLLGVALALVLMKLLAR